MIETDHQLVPTTARPERVLASLVFAPAGRRAVATGEARARRAQPVDGGLSMSPPRRGGGVSRPFKPIPSPLRGESASSTAFHGFRIAARCSTRGYIPRPRWGRKAAAAVSPDHFADVSEMVRDVCKRTGDPTCKRDLQVRRKPGRASPAVVKQDLTTAAASVPLKEGN